MAVLRSLPTPKYCYELRYLTSCSRSQAIPRSLTKTKKHKLRDTMQRDATSRPPSSPVTGSPKCHVVNLKLSIGRSEMEDEDTASWERYCARKGVALRRAVVHGDLMLYYCRTALVVGVGIAALAHNMQ